MLSSESPNDIAAYGTAIMNADMILLFNLRPWDLREDESQVSLSGISQAKYQYMILTSSSDTSATQSSSRVSIYLGWVILAEYHSFRNRLCFRGYWITPRMTLLNGQSPTFIYKIMDVIGWSCIPSLRMTFWISALRIGRG
jgi:hypothetical protein